MKAAGRLSGRPLQKETTGKETNTMHLEMKNIVMEFGPVRAVDDVSITVNQGEIVGLLGENGAGKSTLMNVLAGVYTPVSGQILIDG